jgi:hypothetical protein
MSRQRVGRLLLAATLAAAGWAALLLVTGGVDGRTTGVPIRSHDPRRPAVVAALLAIAYVWRFRRDFDEHWTWLADGVRRAAPVLAAIVSASVLAIGLRAGSFVAGGADAYGYVSQADLWLAGDLVVEQPIVREVPWSLADWSFSPLGYRPSVDGRGMVPTYAPGLPMLMAGFKWIAGACGPYYVVPLLGTLTVWFTFVLGRQLASPTIGLAAAILLAAGPAFLFMLLWPMSDVPVSTFWVGALVALLSGVRLRALWTGLLLSGGILVRPNLAPIAGIFALWLMVGSSETWRQRLTNLVLFGIGLLPGVAAVAIIHDILYGAPWKSGYGDLESLYSLSFFATNIRRYPRWLVDTQTTWIFAFIVPPVVALGRDGRRVNPLIWVGAFTLSVWLAYLFYYPFNDWWYLRFLLPAYPPMLVLALIASQMALSWIRPAFRGAALTALFGIIAGLQITTVRDQVILHLGPGERTYISVAAFVDRELPPNAILLSMQHSGSLRLYGGRMTLRYDWLGPEWWPRVLDVLTAKGFRPYVVLDDWEVPQFQKRFAAQAGDATLPGRLIAKLEPGKAVYVFDPLSPAGVEGAGPRRIDHMPDRVCDHTEMRRLIQRR